MAARDSGMACHVRPLPPAASTTSAGPPRRRRMRPRMKQMQLMQPLADGLRIHWRKRAIAGAGTQSSRDPAYSRTGLQDVSRPQKRFSGLCNSTRRVVCGATGYLVLRGREVGLRSERKTQMDWNIIEGKWKELKGHAREEWGRLTDDELEEVGARRIAS